MTGYVRDASRRSWGRVIAAEHQVARPAFTDEIEGLLANRPHTVLPVGLHRSYGDSGLNAGGALLDLTGLNRLISFDEETGVLHAEAGTTLADVLAFAIPRGFFLPVTPGTKHVTLGGAVANDVHGKNHPTHGTFGNHVEGLGLLRSGHPRQWLTPDDPSGLFNATIAGLGLTGVITDVAIKLRPIAASDLDAETIAFGDVKEFFQLAAESVSSHEYTVAWIDCLKGGSAPGRGIFTRANHAASGTMELGAGPHLPMPFDLPSMTLNSLSVRAFNWLYYHKHRLSAGRRSMGYDAFFYPLDGINNWNRMYGRRGFYQYQCVIPSDVGELAIPEMVRQIARAGEASFLVVLKSFGRIPSPGLLSFPTEGATLALDFPNRGSSTLALLDRLDAVVDEAQGRLYPAKDGRIPPKMFKRGYPRASEFAAFVDPAFSSSFWRRVAE